MAKVGASLVKELREATGAGMMDCKKALEETDGDIEAAIDWLRKEGLSSAAKKSTRAASEGLVGIKVINNCGAIVEINSETDFVARNEEFQSFVESVTELSLEKQCTIEELVKLEIPGAGAREVPAGGLQIQGPVHQIYFYGKSPLVPLLLKTMGGGK